MDSIIIARLLDAFECVDPGSPAGPGANFDLLVRFVESRMNELDRQTIQHFGARVDSVVASILAPLIETGEVVWDARSRVVAISEFGILLLRGNIVAAESAAPQLAEPQVVSR